MMQINHTTKRAYEGNNQDALYHAQMANGFSSPEWLTFCQARDLGRKVKKGSKAVHLNRVLEFSNKKGEVEKRVTGFAVFNLDQTE